MCASCEYHDRPECVAATPRETAAVHSDWSELPNGRSPGDEEAIECWIREAREGSVESLERLLCACRSYLLAIANRTLSKDLRAKFTASDIVQDTMLDVLRDFGDFRGDRLAQLLSWLRTILLHKASNKRRLFERTEKRDVTRELSIEHDAKETVGLVARTRSPASLVVDRERKARLNEALSRLPDSMRLAIQLRNLSQLSFIEVGEKMNRSPDAARKLWARAIERLRSELAKHFTPDEMLFERE